MKKTASAPRLRSANSSSLNGDQLDSKQLLAALTAFKRGDFSAQLPDDWTGIAGKVADTFNDVIGLNQRLTQEIGRASCGKECRSRGPPEDEKKKVGDDVRYMSTSGMSDYE